ncbi:MAG: PBP1A family penicillin-binding protein [Holophagales bacterium]|nr:PBP1A family penicillin-binding protein [Holophagales bacterium]MYF96411.1 PBP1A family penicillin-binding protein [Holophagales bacterium]
MRATREVPNLVRAWCVGHWRWLAPIAATPVAGVLLGVGVATVIDLPQVETVAELTPSQITRLSDRHGEPFRSYSVEKRILLAEGEVPETFARVLLAAEDRNFYAHAGFDIIGVFRAVLQNWRRGERFSGASTITMQVARMLFLDRAKVWRRKIRETLLAVELEKRLSKQQILTLYCNLTYFGHGNYGVESASRYYFGKPSAELTYTEAATLVAIVPSPSVWTPYLRPEIVRTRRDAILRMLGERGVMTRDAAAEAAAMPLDVVTQREPKPVAPYFAEKVRLDLYRSYGQKGLYERGLQVQTTLDQRMQHAAEQALREGLARIDRLRGYRGAVARVDQDDLTAPDLAESFGGLLARWVGFEPEAGAWVPGVVLQRGRESAEIRIADHRFMLEPPGYEWTRRDSPPLRRGDIAWFELRTPDDAASVEEGAGQPRFELELVQEPRIEGAVLLLESATGAVRAMVGGWDYKRSEFNRAFQARRQVGSLFKPLVFGAAFEHGFTPADTLFDAPAAFLGADNQLNYSPRNFYRQYLGILTLRRALERSVNVTSVKLHDIVGAERVVDFAHRTGVRSPLLPYPSLALGAADLTVLEVATSYATIANLGVHVEPYFVERVTTRDGRELDAHVPQASTVVTPEVAFLLTHVLSGVVQRGTGQSARALGLAAVAGKTGTTDGFTDAWFAGFTPRYTLVVWVGYDQQQRIGRNMTGAVAALPIWNEVLRLGIEDGWVDPTLTFTRPNQVRLRQVEYHSGLLPARRRSGQRVIEEAFIAGTEPVLSFDPETRAVYDLPWYQQRTLYGEPKAGENMPEDVADWTPIMRGWQQGDRADGS